MVFPAIALLADEAAIRSGNTGMILLTVGLGLAMVFIGLICIIGICKLVSYIVRLIEKKPAASDTVTAAAPADTAPIADRPALSAVIAAAVAEELGTDVSGIRIHSIKKIR